ncbi:MAG: S-layer homology domain-containing protein [Candidatus Peregrinibacteria bacterium]|nr:S-layer homology domain-containing protein [Candidatus Peregrinibacteria bacterium]MDZ4245299.1 S-layer homology domain-containing protein [Candidatus Gracilibacteria bacterium]
MKKTFISLVFGIISIFIFSNIGFAVAKPTINPVKSPFKGTKQVITGTTAPNARITVTGGPYQIPPINADASGHFELVLSLTQNNTNIFQVSATVGTEISDQIQITIVESATEASAHQAQTGQDYSAPDAPVIETLDHTVDAYFYTIRGDAEPETRIFVTGDDEVETVTSTSGIFSAKVRLNQAKKNTFYLEAHDADGNISPKTKFEILEKGETGEVDDVRVVIDETNGTNASEPSIADPFTDIAGHTAEEYIEALRLQGVLQGYEDGTVRPDAYVNRAELLKMAMLSFQINVLTEASRSPFSDVPRFIWFARFVETAKEEGIVTGYIDGNFRPDQTVNRAEALKIILESSQVPYNPNPPAEYLFSDVKEENDAEWHYKYVYFLKQNSIISAFADGGAHLSDQMTRGDLAEIIVRLQNFQNQ